MDNFCSVFKPIIRSYNTVKLMGAGFGRTRTIPIPQSISKTARSKAGLLLIPRIALNVFPRHDSDLVS